MKEEIAQSQFPRAYMPINDATRAAGFTMASDVLVCSLLRTLAGAKPAGRLLELGTGTGLSTTWILDGMDHRSTLTSIDNEPKFLEIAHRFLGADERLELIAIDGGDWIAKNKNEKFDFIFADTWHGKYLLLDEVLAMLSQGGLYIIDDMLPQSNWPEGHQEKAAKLMDDLASRTDLLLARQAWATGVIVAVKK